MKKKQQVKLPVKLVSIGLGVAVIGFSAFVFTYESPTGLTLWETIQNIANPSIRYVRIIEGMRKEEVADRFAKTLGWSDQEKQSLILDHTLAFNGESEGYFYPDTYIVSARAKPNEVSNTIKNTFKEEVVQKQEKLENNIINTDTAIKIASIIQREARDKNDMRIISGVIWNRLFKGMTLDMDATLQYAKGTDGKWWPVVKSEDKKINSPYNTYKNKGLPPSAISNPGDAAISAALNPIKTKALFYFHDKNGNIHTAETYEQHVANINAYLK